MRGLLLGYFRYIAINECVFWGVKPPESNTRQYCSVWTYTDRQRFINALVEARLALENALGYPIIPTAVEAERHDYAPIAITRWGHIVALATQTEERVAEMVNVDHTSDPAVVTVTVPEGTLGEELEVRHAGTEQVVYHDTAEVDVGMLTATITIPRCRLVRPSHYDNPTTGWDYDDMAVFAAEVDVWRRRTTTLNTVTLRRYYPTAEQEASAYVRNARMGVVALLQSSLCSSVCGNWDWMDINYIAGGPADAELLAMLYKLTHARMPDPCATCEPMVAIWRADRSTPQVLTAERLNCPFGVSDGAWVAWQYARTRRLYRARLL